MTGHAAPAPLSATGSRRRGRSSLRNRSARMGLAARIARGFAHSGEMLEAPVSRYRGTLLAVCGCMLAGWATLIGTAVTALG